MFLLQLLMAGTRETQMEVFPAISMSIALQCTQTDSKNYLADLSNDTFFVNTFTYSLVIKRTVHCTQQPGRL
jgi:hypothetical protein